MTYILRKNLDIFGTSLKYKEQCFLYNGFILTSSTLRPWHSFTINIDGLRGESGDVCSCPLTWKNRKKTTDFFSPDHLLCVTCGAPKREDSFNFIIDTHFQAFLAYFLEDKSNPTWDNDVSGARQRVGPNTTRYEWDSWNSAAKIYYLRC